MSLGAAEPGTEHTAGSAGALSHREGAAGGSAGMAPGKQVQDLLRALAHPIRLRMLSLLTGEPLSAAELARALGITHANASYHLRLLARAGQVELAGIDEVRGGRARRYRYRADDKPSPGSRRPASADTPSDHLLVYAALAEELRRRAASAVRTTRQTLTDAELWVDESAWTTFVDRLSAASSELHNAARPPHTEGTLRVSATMAAFQMTEGTPTAEPAQRTRPRTSKNSAATDRGQR